MLGYVTPGYFIGEDDVRLEFDTYQSTVKCITQKAKLLQISRENFISSLHTTATWNLLKAHSLKKQKEYHVHIKKTNKARERVSPHLKKGEDTLEPM
jgi:hypothetical protein